MKNQKGFTLLEMMIVLLVISVLLLITIPNVTKHNSTINEKGCEALLKMVEAQIQAYEIDHSEKPASITMLTPEYLDEGQTACPNGNAIVINETGEVVSVPVEQASSNPSEE